MKQKPIPANLYTKDYFLKHNSGYVEWANGQRDAGRFGFMFKLANIKPGDKVLDLGCGRGELGYLCAKAGALVTMVDYSPDAIKLAKETMKEFPKTSFYCVDIRKFPVKDYDHIFCLETFEHLWDWEIEIVLGRAKECGSQIYIFTSPEKNWALKNMPNTMGDKEKHINCHTKESLSALLTEWNYQFIPHKDMDLVVKANFNPFIFNLQLDDLSPATDWPKPYLDKLIAEFPGIKIDLFLIPNFKTKRITKYPEWMEFVKTLPRENFEIAVHGYTHFTLPQYTGKGRNDFAEFENLTYDEAIRQLDLAEREMKGIDFVKVFKAPCWYMKSEARRAVLDKGYRIVSLTGLQEEGDIVSGRAGLLAYSTHVGDHDNNTNFLGEFQYNKISNILRGSNPAFKFLSEL